MESLPKNPILEFPPDTLHVIRKMYDLDQPGRMAEAVDILEQWVKKQSHFVKTDLSKKYLEGAIINSKGSIEKAKKQIDSTCTSKSLAPIFFDCTNIREELGPKIDNARFSLLPKLNKDYCRVFLWQITRRYDFESSSFLKFCKFGISLLEYTRTNDYCAGYIMINDFRNIKLTEIMKSMDLLVLQQVMPVVTACYGTRIKALVYITSSKFVENFTKFLKPFLNEKVANRLRVCSNLESLYDIVPKDMLPLEYGGEEKSIDILHNELIDALDSEEHVAYMTEMRDACTDESRRQTDTFNDQYMGMPGTFRSLNVD